MEDVFKDVIEKNRDEKEKLCFECDEIEKYLHEKNKRMEQLQKILSNSALFHVKQLSIIDVQEKERQRIARDLHDTSLQNLTHLIHKTELVSLYMDQDIVKAKLELATIEKGIRKVIDDIRNSIFDLRPMLFDDLGLKDTIEKMLSVINHEKKFRILTDLDDIIISKADSSLQILFISIYRMIKECVQNSLKHSCGDEIRVKLKDIDDTYQICVEDNGTGFDLEEVMKKDKHFGLSIIKERVMFLGGKIDIDTKTGTCITIEIPK